MIGQSFGRHTDGSAVRTRSVRLGLFARYGSAMSEDEDQRARARHAGVVVVAFLLVYVLAFSGFALIFAILGQLGLVPIDAFGLVFFLAAIVGIVYLVRAWIRDGPSIFK